ncbi:tripartite tricarboxylate transporter substrate binding protein [Allopusillimonas soli]|uniref:Tripartite tricarboxylate transporter substrate binding protein n=1 Tax=Allopusillimonas soli TaxID=659016 RepID=A0A853FCZ5_9BURK|nr:tripartite tricarboxylate transporter substrate binding protein [Allopusillimonas soli]NYT37817.1 tripartite tricarboxylate transporter substrate binding protein [Allopusillimonas soli]TEA73725.1 tripartite tricarboxylate transporter substrate binding protein [Allopusillimonas soli]
MKNEARKTIGMGLTAAFAALAWLAPPSAQAAWPDDQPIRMIIPYAPGGATDILGRAISDKLGPQLGQTIVVENKPGAGSMIGSEYVVRAEPDGYTLVLGSISNVLNAYFYKKPLYNLLTDLKPVTQIVTVPNYLAVNKSLPAKNVKELIELAKKEPGKLSCAVSGVGSSPYLSCELFKTLADVNIITAPFKGGAPAIQSTLGGQTSMVFANEVFPYISSGQLRGLGVTTKDRSSYSPDLPAISETLPSYDVTAWYGIWAPIKTPDAIAERLSKEVNEVLKDPAVLQVLQKLGATPVQSSPQAFDRYVRAEMDRWGKLTRKMNVEPQ